VSDAVVERYKEALKRGHMAVLEGRAEDAVGHYRDAAALADHRVPPHLSIGSVLLEMGRAEEALAAYDRAADRAPEDARAHEGRARALTALGREGEARAARDEAGRCGAGAVMLESDRSEAQSGPDGTPADSVPATTGREDPELPLAESEAAIDGGDATEAARLLVAASAAYASRGERDAALDACQRGLAVAPGSVAIHLQMVRCYLARGWTDRAVERVALLDRLLSLDDDEDARRSLRALGVEYQHVDPRLAALGQPRASSGIAVSATL
jgi:tetratricopeptide (TPR) repeat protein